MEICFCSHPNFDKVFATKFCTWQNVQKFVAIWLPTTALQLMKFPMKFSSNLNTPNKHVKQGYETSGKYLRKWLKIWIIFYFGDQNDLEIGPLRLIFNTPPEVAQIDQDWCKTSGNLFEKRTKNQNFRLFWDPKCTKNWASEAHILHTS